MLCRQRQYDDKWEHHLYKDDEPQVSSTVSCDMTRTSAGDLREKLSGTMYSQPVNTDPPKPALKDNKPVRKSVIVEAPEPQTKNVASSVPRKKTQQKTRTLPVLFLPLHFITTVMNFAGFRNTNGSKKEDTLGIGIQSLTFGVDQDFLCHRWDSKSVMNEKKPTCACCAAAAVRVLCFVLRAAVVLFVGLLLLSSYWKN
ncbi:hypothetical protein HYC85_013025 [Camellia sinensis]|uniref:Uncharacterized protein n=1 Tax=Camellia sinensis TaxID=4442 RepID=A0A7J7HDP4_CAMSI|nr:hypothetical protein HYC85_013025 [Camellia sinensis]